MQQDKNLGQLIYDSTISSACLLSKCSVTTPGKMPKIKSQHTDCTCVLSQHKLEASCSETDEAETWRDGGKQSQALSTVGLILSLPHPLFVCTSLFISELYLKAAKCTQYYLYIFLYSYLCCIFLYWVLLCLSPGTDLWKRKANLCLNLHPCILKHHHIKVCPNPSLFASACLSVSLSVLYPSL